MNILTFDIEDWYCHDNITKNLDWSGYETRICDNTKRILDELDKKNFKGTFFCLGWLAEHHPDIIKQISLRGHQIGCHSYQHELATWFDRQGFKSNTEKAKKCIEDAIGKKVELFRAPAFSITENNLFAFDVLGELEFKYDCSIFPAARDFGGMPSFGAAEPVIIKRNGLEFKEFPINLSKVLGRNVVFSGGGYFRLLPYCIINQLTKKSDYVMTYFHPSDFDPDQPKMKYLPKLRQWKNGVGLKSAFNKFRKYLDDFEFVNIDEANGMVDWNNSRRIVL